MGQIVKKGYYILITGIGCVGKSTIRKRIAQKYPNDVFTVDLEADMDHSAEAPKNIDKIVIAESVHGLENNPNQYDKILYLMPPKNHILLWLKRAWIWFSTGVVDVANPQGKNKKYAISNIPIIIKLVLRNLWHRKRWVKDDLNFINTNLRENTKIAIGIDEGYNTLENWVEENLRIKLPNKDYSIDNTNFQDKFLPGGRGVCVEFAES
jgi:hypothetical protein